MDPFVEFNYLLLDTAQRADPMAAGPVVCRERVDVIARQFRDALSQTRPADDPPRGMVLTHDFKVRTRLAGTGGWVRFYVDLGDGTVERLDQVAVVAFARAANDAEVGCVLREVAEGADDRQLPPAPFAVGVRLVRDVPPVVTEFMTKAAAGFFAEEI